MNDKLYSSKKWENVRASILVRDQYMCQYCKRFGKHTQADHVHHVFPREFFPEYTFERWNLISLCKSCHDQMHYRTDRTLTDKGKELAKIVLRKNNLDLEKVLRHEGKQ